MTGRFAAIAADGGVTVCPTALASAPGRATALAAHRAALDAPAGAGPGWALRLATAVRQDLWRDLRAARGAAPVVRVRLTPGGATVDAAVAFLDDARAAPATLDALRRLFHDDAIARWRRHADRALSRGDRARCSTRS